MNYFQNRELHRFHCYKVMKATNLAFCKALDLIRRYFSGPACEKVLRIEILPVHQGIMPGLLLPGRLLLSAAIEELDAHLLHRVV